jgi:polar amino acid transport system substrate-binding protein/two-component system sensor histidine kinase EvgS
LNSIQASSKTLLNLINDILDLSKIEAGQMKIKKEPVNLHNLILDITQVFTLKIKQKQLKLTTEIDTTIPDTIYIDDLKMRQVLLNLIGNAIKFTNNGYIKIIAEKTKTHSNNNIDFAIHIKDSGIGIILENQVKIFEAFKQQENQNTRKYGGTGLGLSITKNLVEMQGGRISVESTIKEGSTFSIYFDDVNIPEDQQNVTISENNIENFDYKFNNETVLIVDDVSSNRFLIQSYLSEANLNIIEAENGAEAIEICKQEKPSIVFMDLRMPILNGIDATNIIKSDESIKDIPIIAVTASLLNFENEKIKDPDFFSFLDKPVSQKKIIKEIIKIIKPSNSRNQTKNSLTIQPTNYQNISIKEKQIFQNTFGEELTNVKNSGNINKIKTLANKIIEFSKLHNIPEILKIATELQFASMNFDIEKVDQIFTEFEKTFSNN